MALTGRAGSIPALGTISPYVYWVKWFGRLTLIRLLKRFDGYRDGYRTEKGSD